MFSIQSITKRIKSGMFAVMYLLASTVTVLMPANVFATSSISYSGTDVTGMVEDVILLGGITVGGDDPTIPVILSVDSGILSMTTTTGLTFNGSSSGSSLSFSGSVADINTALATLQYRTLNATTVTLTATLSEAGQVYFPGNGHMYEIIDNGGGLSWDDAKIAAESLTKNGAQGYLATITTQAENDYISPRLDGSGWFGASDATTEGDWQWATGPETGTSFWAGLGDGAAVSGAYSNWASGEPNDAGGEDCAQFYSDGSGWNDLPCDGPFLDYYVVEYGAEGDLPTAPESISFEITTSFPTANTVSIASCLDLIDVYNNGTDNRYDTLQLTGNIDCDGEDVEPMFTQEDIDFGYIGFRGTFDGQGYEMSNVTISNSGESNVGLFGYTNGATIENVTLGGEVIGDYCVGGLVGNATDTTINNSVVNANVSGYGSVGGLVGCYNVDALDSQLDANTFNGEVISDGAVGGIIGELDGYNEGSLLLTENDNNGTITTSSSEVGGIVGSFYLEDASSAEVSTNTSNGIEVPISIYVGGVIGYAETYDEAQLLVESNIVEGDITGTEYVGGVIGYAYNETSADTNMTITNSHISTNITSTDDDEVGGLIGYAGDVYINQSSTTGGVTGADDEVGGLVGESYNSLIEESFSTGDIVGDDSFVGGLVGRNSETTINRSYATGNVTGDDRVGGLVGANGGYIADSYSRGNVTAVEEVGGLAGRCGREITRSYATGEVISLDEVDEGGLVGNSDGCDVTDSFWDTETTSQEFTSGDGTGKTTEEMKSLVTFIDTDDSEGLDVAWDFNTVWEISEEINDGYPCLGWQDEDCITADDDLDGISTEEEDAAPNGGDSNDDGTADSEQENVAGFVSPVSSEYVALEAPADCSVTQATTIAEEVNTVDDSGYQYPLGLMDFSLDCGTAGYAATVTQYYFNVPESASYIVRKYNPNTNAYFTITDASVVNVTIGGQPAVRVTYEVIDGGILDADGTANGVIVDPAGLALSAVGAPNTGLSPLK